MEELFKNYGLLNGCGASDFIDGRILLIDKPFGWSSFDAVNKVRSLLRNIIDIKKIKVGHAGTLDPLSTGLMILCTGRFTKKIESLMGMDKEYIASVTFGSTTPSFDLETGIDKTFEANHITLQLLKEALNLFKGKQMQTPPQYSAIQINGKRAYEHARKGDKVELINREVEFKELEIVEFENLTAKIRVLCSKGTYIRSFAYDLGKALQSGAHLSALQRTAIGPFNLKEALTIDQTEKYLQENQTK